MFHLLVGFVFGYLLVSLVLLGGVSWLVGFADVEFAMILWL